MYQKYSERNSWKFSPVSSSEVCVSENPEEVNSKHPSACTCKRTYTITFQAEKGGFKTFVLEIKGKRVYSKLKYESGVHRVQRVPQTETQGRVHTSTATVAIMPEVNYFMNLLFCEIKLSGSCQEELHASITSMSRRTFLEFSTLSWTVD